ncbi:2-hydroxy-4-carboxymuconate semialdehyde hemiacetal dehydrogenase [Pseudomonas linyingensis]|uniref:2-hydroxy-4-carboxymuconate semialdehyde hemiacetal dehydrogenase n=1 Tax=Pseudomonas linyingensis TaxID=915471 RepID=A0A1H6X3R5_9PSED|nr:Gfo/Idh/MocA family oxidoreductase [Pseudomonas linyingensis]SEJ19225.1 2-hydroxy-4-carboxymuconate semialdehyde hemiacetal dehydrogenase [Pseudomonas linyingensis]
MSAATPIRILIAGEGAIAGIHLQALHEIGGAEVVCVAGGVAADTAAFAAQWGIPEYSQDFAASLARDDIDAVILASPSPLHAEQASAAIAAGKHVLAEIPMSLNLSDAERLSAEAAATDKVCMVAHTRRFSAPHVELKRRIAAGEFHLQHLVAETYFLRRDNRNMFGKPRSWTDCLLWHHACHSVDLFAWLLDDAELEVWGSAGPRHPELGIPMDMNIGLRARSGAMASLVLSFNNRGPIGGHYRYIGEEATLLAYRDELKDHEGVLQSVPAGSSFARQDAEFLAAIREGRTPESSFAACLPTMRLLDKLDRAMGVTPH